MARSLTLKKKQRFLQLTRDLFHEQILFCPIDISKHFHRALFHDSDCQPLSDFFTFSASRKGVEVFLNHLQTIVQDQKPQLVLIGMEPTDVYYENLLYHFCTHLSPSKNPCFELGIVDPGAVAHNRMQHSLSYTKNDDIDCAAIGELLTRGLYTPARLPEPLTLEIKELSRLLKRRKVQLSTLWNQLLARIERVFPNLLLEYKDEKPLCQSPTTSKLFHNVLHLCPDPYHILSLTAADLIELFHHHGCALGPKNAQKIQQAAQRALVPPRAAQAVHLRLFQRELQLIDVYQQEIEDLTGQLEALVQQTPARHLACIPGSSAKLTAHVLAAVEDGQRFPSGRELWATAGFAPSQFRSGTTVHGTPKVSKIGCPHLRQAIYLLTTSLVWHEPTFGIPCVQRLLQGQPFVPTIIHIGRKIANTALAILKTDQPFHSRYPDPLAAHKQLQRLQAQYQASKLVHHRERNRCLQHDRPGRDASTAQLGPADPLPQKRVHR
jgi:transposase